MQARCGGLAGRRAFLKIGTGAGEQSNAARSIAGLSNWLVKTGVGSTMAEISTRRLAKILRGDIPSAKAGSWGRAAYRNQDKSNSGSRPSLADRSFPRRRMSSRNCRGPETSAAARRFWIVRVGRRTSSFLYRRHRTLLAPVGLQDFLPQSQRLWSDLDKFVIGNEFDSLLQVQISKRHQTDSFVGR